MLTNQAYDILGLVPPGAIAEGLTPREPSTVLAGRLIYSLYRACLIGIAVMNGVKSDVRVSSWISNIKGRSEMRGGKVLWAEVR